MHRSSNNEKMDFRYRGKIFMKIGICSTFDTIPDLYFDYINSIVWKNTEPIMECWSYKKNTTGYISL